MTRLLRIDGSARQDGSRSRALLDALERRLAPSAVVRRDLADGVPLIDAAWIAARDTPAEARGPAEQSALAWSDAAIAELEAADTVAIGLPIYNFGPPAALKAWIDQIARPRVTFRYTGDGPVGLLEGKRAFVAFAAGGTRFGSPIDFASGYMRHILGFVGIDDVRFILDEADLPLDVAA
jgi:FMN-dependent NADH-azoreductase